MLVSGTVSALKPFEKTMLTFENKKFCERESTVKVRVSIVQEKQEPSILEGNIIVR